MVTTEAPPSAPEGVDPDAPLAEASGLLMAGTDAVPVRPRPKSIFSELRDTVYPYAYRVTLYVDTLVGGIPTDARKAKGWLESKLGADKADQVRALVAEIATTRGVSIEEATELALIQNHLNGFKREIADGEPTKMFIEGRQIKAMLKEAANVRWPKEKWGVSNKGTKSYFAEHVFVEDDRVYVCDPDTHEVLSTPTDIHQRFVHTWRGSSIQYEEIVVGAELTFTVVSDADLNGDKASPAAVRKDGDVWGQLLLTGEQQGVGASRSQGFGRFVVVSFDKIGR